MIGGTPRMALRRCRPMTHLVRGNTPRQQSSASRIGAAAGSTATPPAKRSAPSITSREDTTPRVYVYGHRAKWQENAIMLLASSAAALFGNLLGNDPTGAKMSLFSPPPGALDSIVSKKRRREENDREEESATLLTPTSHRPRRVAATCKLFQ